jgi:hypothetical protein
VACYTPGIPNHLHRNGRDEDADFSLDNFIYIRVEPKHIILTSDENGNLRPIISLAAFKSNLQSCNRDKYSIANDVLYNVNATSLGEHFNTWGVISVEKDKLFKQVYQHPELVGISYKTGLSHSSEECMYPHSEVIIYDAQDDTRTNIEINSKTIKAKIRAFYIDNFILEKQPEN